MLRLERFSGLTISPRGSNVHGMARPKRKSDPYVIRLPVELAERIEQAAADTDQTGRQIIEKEAAFYLAQQYPTGHHE